MSRELIYVDVWEFQNEKDLCECPDEWLFFLGGSMLPITEKWDNLVLKAVFFFSLLFLIILAHERLVQKNLPWAKNNTTNF